MKNDYKVGDWVIDDNADRPQVRKIIDIKGNALYVTTDSCFYSNNASLRLATPSEIAAVTGEFVLPARWCIKITEKNSDSIHLWKCKNTSFSSKTNVDEYVGCAGTWSSAIEQGYTEITFDQFKRYVLKEDIKEVKEVEPSKEELLKEAKSRYPIGTRYIPLNAKSRLEIATRAPNIILGEACKLYGVEVGVGYIYLAEGNQWAEIVQDTLKVEDLVEGEYYEFKYADKETIIVKILPDGYMTGCSTKYRYDKATQYIFLAGIKVTKAQFSDRQWLEACISANKFIPKEEALKSKETMFRKDDYIVFTQGYTENDSCFHLNYVFKQREDAAYLRPCLDLQGSKINGWDYPRRFDWTTTKDTYGDDRYKNEWRYATKEEIAAYERLGKPFDVTTLKSKEEWWKTLKKGDVVRCISTKISPSTKKLGKEYEVMEDFDGFIHYSNCKSSDFAGWEFVRRANEVEKWSVGTYVVFLTDVVKSHSGASITKGISYSIVDDFGRDLLYSTDNNGNRFNFFYKEEKLEWFATLEEAEEFSKSLIKKEMPEYARAKFCVASVKEGQIVKTFLDKGKTGPYRWYTNTAFTTSDAYLNLETFFETFEPSTKEAYDLQNNKTVTHPNRTQYFVEEYNMEPVKVEAKSKRIEIYTEPLPVKKVEEIIQLKIREINKIKI